MANTQHLDCLACGNKTCATNVEDLMRSLINVLYIVEKGYFITTFTCKEQKGLLYGP